MHNLFFHEADSGSNGGEEVKTFTQEDIDAIVGKTKAKMEKSFSEQLEATKAEWKAEQDKAAELAKLSEDEKQEKLRNEREQELSAKEKAIQLREYKIEVKEQLSAEGLPSEFVDMVTVEDPKVTQANIQTLKKLITAEVSKGVESGLASYHAKDGGGTGKTSSIGKTYAEKANKSNTVPEDLWK